MQLHGRTLIVGFICSLAIIFTTTAQAHSSLHAVAATAASTCGQQAAISHRSIISADGLSIHNLCLQVHQSLATVSFFDHHRKLIAPRFKTWWKVPDAKWRRTVHKARSLMRHHQAILAKDGVRLRRLRFTLDLEQDFLCIHGYEGDWTANTGNGYYGGLQMDYGFMSTYGPEFLAKYGTADKWPPSVQILVAERAYASGRGFGPWPNTALDCNLSTAQVTPTPELLPRPGPDLKLAL